MRIRCFFLEKTGRIQRKLRRYASCPEGRQCPGYGYHDASAFLDVVGEDHQRDWDLSDPRWPAKCEHCDYVFSEEDEKQLFTNWLYRRTDTGEEMTIRDAGPGAMWDADWMLDKGPDGRCLAVKCPNGRTWIIDGRASNCTMPDDRGHRCWVRHGEPPNITVDKNGLTCQAGAGSIQAGDYHGFLVGGEFSP